MEDIGVPRGFSPSLSGQSAQYSVLPTYLGNNETDLFMRQFCTLQKCT